MACTIGGHAGPELGPSLPLALFVELGPADSLPSSSARSARCATEELCGEGEVSPRDMETDRMGQAVIGPRPDLSSGGASTALPGQHELSATTTGVASTHAVAPRSSGLRPCPSMRSSHWRRSVSPSKVRSSSPRSMPTQSQTSGVSLGLKFDGCPLDLDAQASHQRSCFEAVLALGEQESASGGA
jgi:hypothetical protein